MTAVLRASAYDLGWSSLAALDRIVALAAVRTWARIAAAAPGGPLCLVALYAGSMSSHVEQLSALTERGRERDLRVRGPVDAFEEIWQSQSGWDVEDVAIPPAGTFSDDEMDVDRALERAGCEDAEVAVLLELAYRMSREPSPPVEVSDDFGCFVVEVGEPEVTLGRFEMCARPGVAATYRNRGWMVGSEQARVPVRAGEYALGAEAARRLDELVVREMADVRRSVAWAIGDERVCMVGFIWADPETATATYVSALTELERDATMDRGVSDAALDRLWGLSAWGAADILDHRDEAGTYELADRVTADLEAVDCPEPEEAFLHELAYRLSREPGDLRVTEDFGCFAVEHELIHEAPIAFRASAMAGAVGAYERRGWLRFPDPDCP